MVMKIILTAIILLAEMNLKNILTTDNDKGWWL